MKPLILLTNDDGIRSPGLAAAAGALDPLGDLLIVAPLDQQTSMGRSQNQQCSDGTITKTTVKFGSASWEGFSVSATPALVVAHAILELADRPIDLVVSGINYGENVASSVTVSGTIGAALEAAEKGIPTLAISQEIDGPDYFSYSTDVDFSAAAFFTGQIAEKTLRGPLPFDADILKLEIPVGATPETRCVVTRQDRLMYYIPSIETRETLYGSKGKISHVPSKGEYSAEDTDAYALSQGWVSITPLSFDLTSRVSLDGLGKILSVPSLAPDEKRNDHT
ncbi:MAG: 5'/3'-nucleotidase SurE [Anaerolineales bacterium]|nr:5'/3'-nucleotidase SurE [Anaerolineales bacterium]